jgi:hypothetical protein
MFVRQVEAATKRGSTEEVSAQCASSEVPARKSQLSRSSRKCGSTDRPVLAKLSNLFALYTNECLYDSSKRSSRRCVLGTSCSRCFVDVKCFSSTGEAPCANRPTASGPRTHIRAEEVKLGRRLSVSKLNATWWSRRTCYQYNQKRSARSTLSGNAGSTGAER